VVDGGWVDSGGGFVELIEYLACELSLQQHLCALWKNEVINEAGGRGHLVEYKFLQCGEANAFFGRCGEQFG
jgi:hypothetical protein